MNERAVRVLVVDDQALVRAGFRLILNTHHDLEVVGEAMDGTQAITEARRVRPDVILMDIRMPQMDGIEATRRILNDGSNCRIIMLTTFDLDEYVYAALQAGASGFLLKDVSPEQLTAAVRLVAAGDALLAPSITRRFVERFARPSGLRSDAHQLLASLTHREREVFEHMARGSNNAEIATTLSLSEATVKTHVARILSKLDLRDRVQAVVLAYESGVIQPGTTAP
ncbi:MAG TPA: response regulator transcription factor [Nitrolancea sp.]